MTGFRLFCCFCLLFASCSLAFAEAQQKPPSPDVVLLQQENASLQSKIRRLERQVKALREEMNSPDATQVIGGIGYVVGIFGIAGWLAARKKSGQGG